MTYTEILREIEHLSFQEQSRIYEALTRLRWPQAQTAPSAEPRQPDLLSAAHALLADYEADPELTAFTALDSEEFHATR